MRQDGRQRGSPGDRLDDEAVVFTVDDDLVGSQLELAWDSESLVPPVPEEPGAAGRSVSRSPTSTCKAYDFRRSAVNASSATPALALGLLGDRSSLLAIGVYPEAPATTGAPVPLFFDTSGDAVTGNAMSENGTLAYTLAPPRRPRMLCPDGSTWWSTGSRS